MSGFDAERLERIGRHYRRYVDDGRLPGFHLAVTRDGELAYEDLAGARDLESADPVGPDTLWRIFSMTKPITSVAAMLLWEEGAFELKDPIERWLPEFGAARVWRGGTALKPVTVPLIEPVRVWHLLTHTSGLTYGFHHTHPVDRLYREAGFEWATPPGLDLAACCEAWARLPLLFEPGTEWNYGVSTDVLGRLVEIVSGQRLDAFLTDRVFAPLGMADTGFWVQDADVARLAALYAHDPATGRPARHDALGELACRPPEAPLGGGGLVSTMADYRRFAAMLLDYGRPLLGTRTLRFMARNHLPGGADLEAFGRPLFAETTFDGVGFGLGFAVVQDPVANRVPSSVGELAWGGTASTAFFVDLAERITAVFMTQLMPSTTYPLRSQLRQLVYQALVD